jgi:hypothetical protein
MQIMISSKKGSPLINIFIELFKSINLFKLKYQFILNPHLSIHSLINSRFLIPIIMVLIISNSLSKNISNAYKYINYLI